MIRKLSKRRPKVAIHQDGPTIEGILMGRSRGHYVLRSAAIERDEESSFRVAGEIHIPCGRVMFYQVLDE